MSVNLQVSEVIRWIEDTQGKITFAKWKARKVREDDTRFKKTEAEATKRMKRESQRVNPIVLQYFRPEVEGELREWNKQLREMLEDVDLAHEANIFDGEKPILHMSHKEILNRLSRYLPDYRVEAHLRKIPDTNVIPWDSLRFIRMEKR